MRTCQYFDHVVGAARLHKWIMKGEVEGTRKKGIPRKSWIGEVGEAVELGMVECSRSRAQRYGKRWSWAWWSAVGLERRGAGSGGAGHGGVQ